MSFNLRDNKLILTKCSLPLISHENFLSCKFFESCSFTCIVEWSKEYEDEARLQPRAGMFEFYHLQCVCNVHDKMHSRPQRPRSFWSAPRIETSGCSQNGESVIHGFIVKSDKSDWLKTIVLKTFLRTLKSWDWPEVSILGADERIAASVDENGQDYDNAPL